jgi:hypothetical protein
VGVEVEIVDAPDVAVGRGDGVALEVSDAEEHGGFSFYGRPLGLAAEDAV